MRKKIWDTYRYAKMYISMGEMLENLLFFRHTKKLSRKQGLWIYPQSSRNTGEPYAGDTYWIEQIEVPLWFKNEADQIILQDTLDIARRRRSRMRNKKEKKRNRLMHKKIRQNK